MKQLVFSINILIIMMMSTTKALQLSFQTFQKSVTKTSTPVLFIHGLDSSKHTWRKINHLLQEEGINSVSVDLRGWGESPLGDRESFCIDEVVKDLEQFVREHNLLCSEQQKMIVVGHSMGGRVASCFAAANSELVRFVHI